MSYQELKGKISIGNPSDTRILTLTVEDSDPVRAKAFAKQIVLTASDYIGDIMETVPPKIVEEGEIATTPNSPNMKRNGILGALWGAVAACAVLSLRVILDDTMWTEDDVERYLNLPVLALVPSREPVIPKKSGARKRIFTRRSKRG